MARRVLRQDIIKSRAFYDPASLSPSEELHYLQWVASKTNTLVTGSKCSCQCLFCFRKYYPKESKIFYLPEVKLGQLRRIFPYLRKDRAIRIGMFGNIMDGDFFDHDQAMPILESLRQRFPQTELVINSSRGTNLNKPAIRNMADYKNILLRLQFVSANKKNRDMLVKRPSTDTEITSVLGWLRKYQLPFEIELVAIPHLLGWKDIERTFFFLDDYAPVRIKVYLFSFTKYYIKELTFSNNKKLLREFYSLVNKVSNKIGTRIDPFPRPVSKGDVQPDLLRVKQIRRTYKGRILFLVSQMAYPAIKKHISDTDGIKVKMAKNLFFGGNISVAGLLTAEDYLQAAGKEEFDVLVVSSKPFNYAGYDLKGDHKRLLKQRLGKKVLYI